MTQIPLIVTHLGFYVPLTKESNIIVNGVLASSYGSYIHDLVHVAMTPMQLFPEIMNWIFGEDNGNSVYVKIGQLSGEGAAPNSKLHKKNTS